jgi:hypothetical protein
MEKKSDERYVEIVARLRSDDEGLNGYDYEDIADEMDRLREENAALKSSNVLRALTELFEEGIEEEIDAMTDEEISAECERHGFNTDEVVRRVKEALKTAKEKADGNGTDE